MEMKIYQVGGGQVPPHPQRGRRLPHLHGTVEELCCTEQVQPQLSRGLCQDMVPDGQQDLSDVQGGTLGFTSHTKKRKKQKKLPHKKRKQRVFILFMYH
jgi:hypothetical protein